MTRSWSQTICRRCGHEERRYANVKRCRVCAGPLERPQPSDDRLVLARRIVDRARMWAAHDDVLAELIREWGML